MDPNTAKEKGQSGKLKEPLVGRIRTLQFEHLKKAAKDLLYECTYDKPVLVENVSFGRNHLQLDIRWPFLLPEPTGDPEERLGTSKSVDRFSRALAKHLGSRRVQVRLSNFLFSEFCEFLPGYLQAYRFGQAEAQDSVLNRLRGFCRQAGNRRLAGRRKQGIPESLAIRMQPRVKRIYKIILKMKKKVRGWRNENRNLDEASVVAHVQRIYDRHRYPWMRYFPHALSKLPRRRGWWANPLRLAGHDKSNDKPKFSDPDSWSASGLTCLILQKMYYRNTGIRYPLSKIRKLLHPKKTAPRSTRIASNS